MSDRIYTGTPGTNCTIDGESGKVTAFQYRGGNKVGAFVQLMERPAMLHVELSLAPETEYWQQVFASREIDRDEFDRLIGVPDFRHDYGWRDPKPIRTGTGDTK